MWCSWRKAKRMALATAEMAELLAMRSRTLGAVVQLVKHYGGCLALAGVLPPPAAPP